jgi:hypothetical protein
MRQLLRAVGSTVFAILPACVHAQNVEGIRHTLRRLGMDARGDSISLADSIRAADSSALGVRLAVRFRSRADSLSWISARRLASQSVGYRVVVSLFDRQLWVLRDDDTLITAPVAVGMNSSMEFAGRTWTFETPRGRRTVLRKDEAPVWTPPVWHYAEVAQRYGLKLRPLPLDHPVRLHDGSLLEVHGDEVGVFTADSGFAVLSPDEEVVFDSTLFVPPIGTKNRKIDGELGPYRLDLGGGYLLHGTPHLDSIGSASTHGCVRLRDEDIAWLYYNVPVGTKVYIY